MNVTRDYSKIPCLFTSVPKTICSMVLVTVSSWFANGEYPLPSYCPFSMYVASKILIKFEMGPLPELMTK
jgi:hypothetical protein